MELSDQKKKELAFVVAVFFFFFVIYTLAVWLNPRCFDMLKCLYLRLSQSVFAVNNEKINSCFT